MEELLIILSIVFFFGALTFDGCTSHSEKMECIKQRGEWVGSACKFPPAV